MFYEFRCERHGYFQVRQNILATHKANCPQCGEEAQRVYASLEWIWADTLYREDGSRREDKDYAEVMHNG